MKDHILLLGATGRIGRLVEPYLRAHPVFFQSRNPDYADAPQYFSWHPSTPPPQDWVEKVDIIISLAGVTPKTHNPDFSANINVAHDAVTLAQIIGAQHVFLASSSTIYGSSSSSIPYDETMPPAPVNEYGKSKMEMEIAFAGHKNVTCLRIGNIAGADMLLSNATEQKTPVKLHQFSDGHGPLRSYIGVKTLANIFLSLRDAVQNGQSMPPSLNIASPHPVYMEDLLDALDVQSKPLNWSYMPAPKSAVARFTLSTTQLQSYHSFSSDDSEPSEMVRQYLRAQDMMHA